MRRHDRKFNSSRSRLQWVNAEFAAAIPSGALVLDAGAGTAPYRELFSHTRYETADFQKVDKDYAESTYVCDLSAIPVEGDRFDFIVFNQVMEHLPEPKTVLREFYRVLKPGGKIIYTGPLFYAEHEQPYDFYRYTQFGLRYLFADTGYELEKLEWLEGYYGTVAYQFETMSRDLPAKPEPGILGYLFLPLVVGIKLQSRVFARIFHWLELRHKHTRSGYPKNYMAILKKPESTKTMDTETACR